VAPTFDPVTELLVPVIDEAEANESLIGAAAAEHANPRRATRKEYAFRRQTLVAAILGDAQEFKSDVSMAF